MSEDLGLTVEKVNKAMIEANGKRGIACRALRVMPKELDAFIFTDIGLMERWIQKKERELTELEVTNRMPRPKPNHVNKLATLTDEEVKSLDAEDRMVRAGLEKISAMSPDLRETVMAFKNLYKKHFSGVLDLLGSGVIHTAMSILTEVSKVGGEIAACEDDIDREQMLREDRRSLYDLYLKAYDRANKAALARAEAERKKKGGGKSKKPGFAPLAIQADKVTIVDGTTKPTI